MNFTGGKYSGNKVSKISFAAEKNPNNFFNKTEPQRDAALAPKKFKFF
jgi:hypothetical protein